MVCWGSGFSLWSFLKFIRGELLLVLGTSSSESAMPRMLRRLEEAGCARSVVGLVLPTGYSFNLDGTCIYLTMAAVFIAQAVGVDLSLREELILIGVLLLTSKGAAGVTGSGFITLAATLSVLGGKVPVEGVALTWVLTALCPKRAQSPTSSATASPPWSSPNGKACATTPSCAKPSHADRRIRSRRR